MNRPAAPFAAVVCLALVAAGCQQQSETDRKLAELQQQLDDTKQQLAATKSQTEQAAATAAEGMSTATQAATAAETAAQRQAAADQQLAAQAAKDRVLAERANQGLTSTQKALADQQAATARQAEEAAALRRQMEAMRPRDYTLDSGTPIPVRTTAQVSTKMSTGAAFDAVLEQDLVVDGTLLARSGALVTCVVTSSDPGGKVKGVASISVSARSIEGVAGPIAVKTSSYGAEAKSTKGKDAARTGIATGAGAVIGAIAGGGKGAAIGAGIGAGAGVGATMATRGDPAVIASETLIEFRLTAPVTVTLTPKPR